MNAWDDDAPVEETRRFTIHVSAIIDIEITAPKGSTDADLADIAQEYLESDSAIDEATITGSVDVLKEEAD